MKTPGFTAEAAVRKTIGHYRAMAPTTVGMAAATLMPALQWVDCNKLYNSDCQECGAAGPGSFKCCSGFNCVVIDKNPLSGPPQPVVWWPAGGVFAF